MNYRHHYHAGNFADVFKHAVLASILTYQQRKEKPLCVLDTHAGPGLYDLSGIEAQRTGEFRDGIFRILDEADPPADMAPYLDGIRSVGPGYYPGSPCLVQALLRPADRLIAAELHPEDVATLSTRFRQDRRVAVHHMDGYLALKAFLPPPERRGLVLIDPPFEVQDEFSRLAQGLALAHSRWPSGVYAAWYPIKTPAAVFHAALERSGIPAILTAELWVRPLNHPMRLNGCGLAILNPPWTLPETLERILPFLCRVLARETGAGWQVRWLTPRSCEKNGPG
ncbi:MAG: 23S rRNA (adenine(2030)-N(6))-methyltransferase RlmJ [Alphaproteobacteria bacterium]